MLNQHAPVGGYLLGRLQRGSGALVEKYFVHGVTSTLPRKFTTIFILVSIIALKHLHMIIVVIAVLKCNCIVAFIGEPVCNCDSKIAH